MSKLFCTIKYERLSCIGLHVRKLFPFFPCLRGGGGLKTFWFPEVYFIPVVGIVKYSNKLIHFLYLNSIVNTFIKKKKYIQIRTLNILLCVSLQYYSPCSRKIILYLWQINFLNFIRSRNNELYRKSFIFNRILIGPFTVLCIETIVVFV